MSEIRQNLRFNSLDLEDMNRIMGQLADRLDELEGRRGTPLFKSNVDMEGNRLTDMGASAASSDATTKAELDGLGASTTLTLDSLQTMIDDLTTRLNTSVWPVGSIFISIVSTNPATLLGFGTWTAFGAGRFLVGLKASDTDFDTAEETGGDKTKDLSHIHTVNHTHPAGADIGMGANFAAAFAGNSGTGGSLTQDILPPYIVVYMWKRSA